MVVRDTSEGISVMIEGIRYDTSGEGEMHLWVKLENNEITVSRFTERVLAGRYRFESDLDRWEWEPPE